MDSTPKISVPNSKRPAKRLLFDRRYGWVFDEWHDPSEQALVGGRGMFCILPLAKGLLKMASQSINLAASSAVKVIERPDLLSPQVLQASFKDELQEWTSSLQETKFNLFSLKGEGKGKGTPSHPLLESSGLSTSS